MTREINNNRYTLAPLMFCNTDALNDKAPLNVRITAEKMPKTVTLASVIFFALRFSTSLISSSAPLIFLSSASV